MALRHWSAGQLLGLLSLVWVRGSCTTAAKAQWADVPHMDVSELNELKDKRKTTFTRGAQQIRVKNRAKHAFLKTAHIDPKTKRPLQWKGFIQWSQADSNR